MSFIPIMEKEYPDEFMYSWLHRLAKINEMPFERFACAYLGHSRANIGKTRVDIRNEFIYLYNNLYEKRDFKEMFLSLSTFPFESLFMTEGQQTKYINYVSRKTDELNRPTNCLFDKIRICPECVKEDMNKYGEAYLHRSHHLYGVCTCSKHKIGLLEYVGKKGYSCDYDLNDYNEIEQVDIDINNEYTSYVQALFESNVCGNILDFKTMLFKRLRELDYSPKNGYEDFVEEFNKSKYRVLFNGSLKLFFEKTIANVKFVTPIHIIPIFMKIYPDVNEVIKILSKNLSTLNTYHCDICGKDYFTTHNAIDDGWNCPYCDENKTIQERYEQLIIASGEGLYEPVSMFESLNKDVILHHTICGEDINIVARRFLFENARCKCERIVTLSEAKNAIEKDGEYELVDFISASQPIRVKRKECKHEFPCRYSKFIKSPRCRICRPARITTEIFKERVKLLTGDEYTVLGEVENGTTKVDIRHNKCETTDKYYPSHFLSGQRCGICTQMDKSWNEWYDLLCQYVEEFGNADIAKRDKYKGKDLGRWANYQRNRRKEGKLYNYQIEKLDELNFCWDPLEGDWDTRYEQYKRYVESTGNKYMSRRTDFEGVHLGSWFHTQIKSYEAGEMSKRRIDKMKKINPDIFNDLKNNK